MFSPYSPLTATLTAEVEAGFLDTLSISGRYQLKHPASSNVLAAKFSPDSRLIAVSYADGTLQVLNSLTGKVDFTLQESFMKSSKSPKKILAATETPPLFTSLCWKNSGL
jgi:WD40 repeat protein